MLERRQRLGAVMPPGNAAVEPELQQLLAPHVDVYASRFPVLPGRSLRERLDTYNDVLPDTIANFGSLALDAVTIACSGSHYLFGPDDDRTVCAELTDRFGVPVASATQATLDTLSALGITQITLVSPYQPWLTQLSAGYWEAAGLTIRRVVPLPSPHGFSPYDVTTADIVRTVHAARPAADEPLFFTGTGMFTLAALRRLDLDGYSTLLTSNICSAWWTARTVGRGADEFAAWPTRCLTATGVSA